MSVPVRVPHSPRGYGWVVRYRDGWWVGDSETVTGHLCSRTLATARLFKTADDASKHSEGDEVFSLALARELVGEREGRG